MPGAIVIGAGPGIGTAVARRLAREGLAIAVLARSQATVDEALAALDAASGPTFGVTADDGATTRTNSALASAPV